MDYKQRLLSFFDETDRRSKKHKLYIFGTGNTSALYQEGLLRNQETFDIDGYVVSSASVSEKWGKKVYSIADIAGDPDALVLISTSRIKTIREIEGILNAGNIANCHVDDYIFRQYRDDILKCYDMLEDDFSKRVYSEMLICRAKGLKYDEEIFSDNQYFSLSRFWGCNEKDVFVDCGAYVGDSIERFLFACEGVFGKIIAIEPDAYNLKALDYRLDRLKKEWNLKDEQIEIYKYGVSDKSETKYIESYAGNNGLGSKVVNVKTEDSEECGLVALDDIITDRVDFIKADIESYEYKMLLGAEKTIKKYAPKLAICIYHNGFDFFQLQLLIHSFNPDYHFAIRHYGRELSETVLYAYTD